MKLKLATLGIPVICMLAVLASACGSYSSARRADLDQMKDNQVHTVKRALEDKLTAVEMRSSLETIDKAILAEEAHKGKEANLEKVRKELLEESDKAVAELFDGDNGREAPGSGPGEPPAEED